MADIILPVRFRDAEARSSVDRLQQAINALRGDVNQLSIAFQSATGPATRFGTSAAAGLARANASSRGLLGNVRALRGAFAGLFVGGGLALAARSFARLNDAATNTESLLRQITGSSQELERSQGRIYQLALDLRTPVRAITTLYSRTALALGDAYDPARVEQFTRSIAQLGRATGATEQEFVNATRQLVQGLGSGKLAGDELRGVLEGLPAVGRELARELQVPFGQLRQLGRTGQLTPQVVFDALSGPGVAERAEAAFAEVGLTFGQVFDRFATTLQREFGEIEQTGSLISDLDDTLQDLAKNVIPPLTAGLTSLVNVLGPLETLLALVGISAGSAAVGPLSARRRNIQGASTNVSQLLSGITTRDGRPVSAATRDDIVRLVRSNAVSLGPASSEFATRSLRINQMAFDRFVAEVGATRGRDARTVLSRISTRDFVALQDALRYLDRVGAAGRPGFARTASRVGDRARALTSGGALLRAAPVAGATAGWGGLAAAGGVIAYGFIDALTREKDNLGTFFTDAAEAQRSQQNLYARIGEEYSRRFVAPVDPVGFFKREIDYLVNDAVRGSRGASRTLLNDLFLAIDREVTASEELLKQEDAALLERHEAFRQWNELRDARVFDGLFAQQDADLLLEHLQFIQEEDVRVDEMFKRLGEDGDRAAANVRNAWLNAFADIGNYARSIFENLFSDSRDLVQVGLDLARIFVRLSVTRERNQGITPSNAAVFARALLGGVPAFHEGRFPSNFNDSREMAAIVRRNETILTPQQLQSVAGSGGGRGSVVNMPIQYVGDFDVRALDLLERRAGTVKAILGLR